MAAAAGSDAVQDPVGRAVELAYLVERTQGGAR